MFEFCSEVQVQVILPSIQIWCYSSKIGSSIFGFRGFLLHHFQMRFLKQSNLFKALSFCALHSLFSSLQSHTHETKKYLSQGSLHPGRQMVSVAWSEQHCPWIFLRRLWFSSCFEDHYSHFSLSRLVPCFELFCSYLALSAFFLFKREIPEIFFSAVCTLLEENFVKILLKEKQHWAQTYSDASYFPDSKVQTRSESNTKNQRS